MNLIAGEAVGGVDIDSFSRGFGNSGLATKLDQDELDELKAKAGQKRLLAPEDKPEAKKACVE